MELSCGDDSGEEMLPDVLPLPVGLVSGTDTYTDGTDDELASTDVTQLLDSSICDLSDSGGDDIVADGIECLDKFDKENEEEEEDEADEFGNETTLSPC